VSRSLSEPLSIGQIAPIAAIGTDPQEARNRRSAVLFLRFVVGALGGIRTPNLLIRSQMLSPLSYERWLDPNGPRRV
jgi:hypothetical protein